MIIMMMNEEEVEVVVKRESDWLIEWEKERGGLLKMKMKKSHF